MIQVNRVGEMQEIVKEIRIPLGRWGARFSFVFVVNDSVQTSRVSVRQVTGNCGKVQYDMRRDETE